MENVENMSVQEEQNADQQDAFLDGWGDEQTALFLPGLNVDGLDDQQLQAVELFRLVGADDRPLYSC